MKSPAGAFLLSGRSLVLMRLAPLPVRRLLRPVAAQRHAAPAPRMAARMVGEQQCAGGSLAGLHLREILRADKARQHFADRSEEHTSELQSLMRISYAVFCLKQKKKKMNNNNKH